MIERVKRGYARILRVPILGTAIGGVVRGIKRLLGLPSARTVDRVEMLQAAISGLKTENERLNERVACLEAETRRLSHYDDQLALLLEIVEARSASKPRKTRSVSAGKSASRNATRRKSTSGDAK
jgi:hypothetical protein